MLFYEVGLTIYRFRACDVLFSDYFSGFSLFSAFFGAPFN
jgi:hypothetical protein